MPIALPGASLLEIQPRYTRDLPYDYAALVENLVDPAHVPWAHHGVLGSRWDNLCGWILQCRQPRSWSAILGYEPCLFWLDGVFHMLVHMHPVRAYIHMPILNSDLGMGEQTGYRNISVMLAPPSMSSCPGVVW